LKATLPLITKSWLPFETSYDRAYLLLPPHLAKSLLNSIPRHVMQDDPDDPDDPYDTHDQSLPVVTQETSDGGRPLFQVYVETADESGDEQALGDSQHLANLAVSLPFITTI